MGHDYKCKAPGGPHPPDFCDGYESGESGACRYGECLAVPDKPLTAEEIAEWAVAPKYRAELTAKIEALRTADTERLDWLENNNAYVGCNFCEPAWSCAWDEAHSSKPPTAHGETAREAIDAAMKEQSDE